jgi:hypothetical protein
METSNLISALAGPVRRKTFLAAIEQFAMTLGSQYSRPGIVETGCYRGIDADGQSTIIWTHVARSLGTEFISVDLSGTHVQRAKDKLSAEFNSPPDYFDQTVLIRDSVEYLSSRTLPIGLLYLDSYDYVESNPLPSQIHQVAEIGAAFGKLAKRAVVLLDDCNMTGGGKGLLTDLFLKEHGFQLVMDEYQKVFVR